MDLNKLRTFITEHGSDYLHAFAATLKNPILRFPPRQESRAAEPPTSLLLTHINEHVVSQRLNPNLLGFAITCIFLGSTLHLIVPGKKTAPGFVIIAILVTFSWLVCSCLVYVICLAFKGRGSFIETISICLQLFAVIYVISSFAALIGGILIAANSPDVTLPTFITEGGAAGVPLGVTPTTEVAVRVPSPFSRVPPYLNISAFFQHPFLLYFLFQMLLLIIYLPIGIKKIHLFRGFKAILVILALPLSVVPFMFVNISTYEVIGTPTGPPVTPTPQERALTGLWLSNYQHATLIFVITRTNTFVMGRVDDKDPYVAGHVHLEGNAILLLHFENHELSRDNLEVWYTYKPGDENIICPAEYRNRPSYYDGKHEWGYRDDVLYLLNRCWTRGTFTEQDNGLPGWATSLLK